MTNTEIKEILDTRGYILEYDCADVPTLSSRQIEDYTGKDTLAIAEEVKIVVGFILYLIQINLVEMRLRIELSINK